MTTIIVPPHSERAVSVRDHGIGTRKVWIDNDTNYPVKVTVEESDNA